MLWISTRKVSSLFHFHYSSYKQAFSPFTSLSYLLSLEINKTQEYSLLWDWKIRKHKLLCPEDSLMAEKLLTVTKC